MKLTPKEIVTQLDRHIIGQNKAKRAVAVALRNRYRRALLPEHLREDILPKNILMIGPTGVGKTEIARRLAKLVKAPFIKVEATKFTEVGYVGRDVESIIRDLTEAAIRDVKEEQMETVKEPAREAAKERLLDVLLPPKSKGAGATLGSIFNIPGLRRGEQSPSSPKTPLGGFNAGSTGVPAATDVPPSPADAARRDDDPVAGPDDASASSDSYARTREKLRERLEAGQLNDRTVEIEVEEKSPQLFDMLAGTGMEEMGAQFGDVFSHMMPQKTRRRKLTVKDALRVFEQEEAEKLIDMADVTEEAVHRVEQSGIVFIDEIDKVAAKGGGQGPDVSREGVQRDILPIVEGSVVITKHGPVRTDHILFIAAGAFHVSKPSDLIPELQGRFPVRVELESLTPRDLIAILTEPENALVNQYVNLLKTEGVTLEFTDEAIDEIAQVAAEVNENTENIGARRLQTIMERLLEELSFEAPAMDGVHVTIDRAYVKHNLEGITTNRDLSHYIL